MSTALTLKNHDLMLSGPVGSLDHYIQAVNSVPTLSAADEQVLAIRLYDHKDLDAARALVLSHLRFVVHIARGYSGYGLPIGDLIQEGNVGLMKAVKRFDPQVGVRLVSFAVHWIRAEIHEYVLKNWRMVKIATTKAQRKLFFNLRSMKQNLSWLTAEETEAVARDLGVPVAEVTEMERRMSSPDMSFDPTPLHEDDDSSFGPAAYLPSADADPAEVIELEDWESNNSRRLEHAIGGLDERSRSIVQRRWLGEGKATLQDLADEYGVSAERVRQIEANALLKLRHAIVD
jgi:RNA polymerase sigma-32 factor